MEVKVFKSGNSLALRIPSGVADAANLEAGDSLYLTQTPDGLGLSRTNPEFTAQMEAYRKVAKRQASILKELSR